jgi:hypothetical protein
VADFNWPLFLLLAAIFLTAPLIALLSQAIGLKRDRRQRKEAHLKLPRDLCSWCGESTPTCYTHHTNCCPTCCAIHHGKHAKCRPLCQRCLRRPVDGNGTLCDWCGI